VARAAKAAGLTRLDKPVTVVIEARFSRPRSHYRKSSVKPTAPPLPRPDCDNVAKAVLAGLQDVMGDDTKVARLVVEKKWAPNGYTKVEVASEGLSVVDEPKQAPRQELMAETNTKESNNGTT
jgi:Holliday junction resolvase RusA-like endonuclease